MPLIIEGSCVIRHEGDETNIIVPENVTEIRAGAFEKCESIESIVLPNTKLVIGNEAFRDCKNLRSIIIPKKAKKIGSAVFMGCESLESIRFDSITVSIPDDFSDSCENAKFEFPEGVFKTKGKISAGFGRIKYQFSAEDIAWLYYYQETDKWKNIIEAMRFDAAEVFPFIWGFYTNENDFYRKWRAEKFFEKYASEFTKEQIEKILELDEDDCLELKERSDIQRILRGETKEENPIEEYVKQRIARHPLNPKAVERVTDGIRYAGSEDKCSKDVLAFIVSEYYDESGNLRILERKYQDLICPDADHVAEALDDDDLSKFVSGLLHTKVADCNHFMPVWGRFSRGYEIYREIRNIATYDDGFPRCLEALMLNDSLDAMLIMYRLEKKDYQEKKIFRRLDEYAKIRGKTTEEMIYEVFERVVDRGIHYEGNDEECPRETIISIINTYELSFIHWKEKYGYSSKPFSAQKEADLLAAKLNQDELSSLLTKIISEDTGYNIGLPAWAKYANDRDIDLIMSQFISKSRGKIVLNEKGKQIFDLLLINDSKKAMELYYQLDQLKHYAKTRGLDAEEIRDSMMLPDFAFDENGIRKYDLGSTIIEVSITQELGFRLFDTTAGKTIRSFPKSATAEAKEFASFKKDVLEFAKVRGEILHKIHLSGEYLKPELWRTVYMNHPVIRHLSELVVWQDETNHTFMTCNNRIFNSYEADYAPQGKIRVAHVLEMNDEDIESWRRWLTESGKKQLFEQIWEPKITWDKDAISSRYENALLSQKERNEMKNEMKRYGITVYAENESTGYNHYTGKYEFSDSGIQVYGSCMKIDYTVDPRNGDTTYKKTYALVDPGNREMNAVLLTMDMAILSSHIAKDNDLVMNSEFISELTIAQINDLLNLAIKDKSEKCIALLLNYKNEHFPNYTDVNEFSLDW